MDGRKGLGMILTVIMNKCRDPGRGARMNLSWRQLLVCGVAAGILGYAGYRILYTSKDEEREGKEKERKNNNNDEPIKVNGMTTMME
jgi:hypothetical protein